MIKFYVFSNNFHVSIFVCMFTILFNSNMLYKVCVLKVLYFGWDI
jgi:hypothetical protein